MRGEDDEQFRLDSGDRMRDLYEATFGETYPGAVAQAADGATAWCASPHIEPGQATDSATAWCASPHIGTLGKQAAWCAGPHVDKLTQRVIDSAGAATAWCASPHKLAQRGGVTAWCASPHTANKTAA
jgi:hypothetical protein